MVSKHQQPTDILSTGTAKRQSHSMRATSLS